MGRRACVAGGAGFIGSHLCERLIKEKYSVICVDNLSTGRQVNFDHLLRHSDFQFISHDITRPIFIDAEEIFNLACPASPVQYQSDPIHTMETCVLGSLNLHQCRVAAVVHLAAYAYVGESMRLPEAYFNNNLAGTLSLLHAMIDVGVPHIVFSSTCATYGVPLRVPIPRDHVQEPVNPYGESKLAIERILRWYGAAHELNWTALRYFNAAGADPDGEIGECHYPETHLIPLAIRTALGLEPWLNVLGTDYPTPDGTAVRDYIHVADLADAHVQALGYLRAGGPSAAFNLGTGRGHSVREITQAVVRVSGRPVQVREAARRPGDVPVLVADSGDSATLLQWRAHRSELEEIVGSAWCWHARLAAGEHPAARRAARASSREPDWSGPQEPMVSAPKSAGSHG